MTEIAISAPNFVDYRPDLVNALRLRHSGAVEVREIVTFDHVQAPPDEWCPKHADASISSSRFRARRIRCCDKGGTWVTKSGGCRHGYREAIDHTVQRVRLERLHDAAFDRAGYDHSAQFSGVWKQLRPGTWDRNPWVWVLEGSSPPSKTSPPLREQPSAAGTAGS